MLVIEGTTSTKSLRVSSNTSMSERLKETNRRNLFCEFWQDLRPCSSMSLAYICGASQTDTRNKDEVKHSKTVTGSWRSTSVLSQRIIDWPTSVGSLRFFSLSMLSGMITIASWAKSQMYGSVRRRTITTDTQQLSVTASEYQ